MHRHADQFETIPMINENTSETLVLIQRIPNSKLFQTINKDSKLTLLNQYSLLHPLTLSNASYK